MNKEILTGRAACYEYLSLVFRRPPDKSFIGISEQFAEHFKMIGEAFSNKQLFGGAHMLASYAATEKQTDQIALLSKLSVTYTRLFNIGTESVLSTCSTALSPDRCNRQEPWENVTAAYYKRKFIIPSDFKDPEDHISMLFLFMSEMSAMSGTLAERNETALLKISLEEQCDFANKFIYTWIPDTCDAIINMTKEGNPAENFYCAVATITNGFIEIDKLIMDEMIQAT